MDGRTYLDAVRYLLAAPSEVNRRAAAGPLYCAALNEARDALERWGFVAPADADVDDFVYERFDEAMNFDLMRIAELLGRVEEYRDLADDSRSPPSEFADDNKVIGLRGVVLFAIDLLARSRRIPPAGRRPLRTYDRGSLDAASGSHEQG